MAGLKLGVTGQAALRQQAKRIKDIPAASRRAAYRAANAVAARTMTQVRRDIGSQLNLPASYIRERMKLVKAWQEQTAAEIRVSGRAIRLARFAARQATRAAPRARGDASRGIAPGRKQAGVTLKVARKGGRVRMPGAFLLPLLLLWLWLLLQAVTPVVKPLKNKHSLMSS